MSLLLLLGGSGLPLSTDEYPTVTVEIAFGHTWQDEAPVWTDVTGYVDFDPGFSIDRGRSRELDQFGTGTASFNLCNDDRRFDPAYADGPYFGDLKPNVPVRIRAVYNTQTFDLFRGFVDGWPQTYGTANATSTVPIAASDAFKLLNKLDVELGFFTLDDPVLGVLDVGRLGGEGFTDEQQSGERVAAILDLATWPDLYRDIDTGASVVQAQDPSNDALSALQLVEQSEDGFLYVEADGDVTFVGRYGRQTTARMSTPQATFSDTGTMPYDDLTYLYDDQLIFNDVRRTREGGVEQSAEDPESIDSYFRRSHSQTGLLMTTDAEAHDLAQVFLERYREPVQRIDDLDLDPSNNVGLMWPQVLGRRILDRITVERTPQELGDPITQDLLIQGIKHSYVMFKWTTTYYVTPADDFDFFTLDDPVHGVLDVSRLGA